MRFGSVVMTSKVILYVIKIKVCSVGKYGQMEHILAFMGLLTNIFIYSSSKVTGQGTELCASLLQYIAVLT